MSSVNPNLRQPIPGSYPIDYPIKTPVDLNDIFREAVQKFTSEHSQVIVRCEILPVILGYKTQLIRLFYNLINMIHTCLHSGSRLFLYIDSVENTDFVSSSNAQEKMYTIKYITNITTTIEWKDQNSQLLIECQQIIENHQGKFAVNEINGTGCLFTITFAGKMN